MSSVVAPISSRRCWAVIFAWSETSSRARVDLRPAATRVGFFVESLEDMLVDGVWWIRWCIYMIFWDDFIGALTKIMSATPILYFKET